MSRQFEDRDVIDQQTGREGTVDRVKGAVSQAAEKAQTNVEQVGRKVQEKIDENRQPAADKLQDLASTMHQKAASLPGGEKVAGLAHSTADKVEATADYLRGHNVQDMAADFENFVRKHPGQSLLAAAAFGFLLGRAFRSEEY